LPTSRPYGFRLGRRWLNLTSTIPDLGPRQTATLPTQGVGVRRPIVFYDGGCRLCRREIDHYRRLRGAERLEWVDIFSDRARLAASGVTFEAALQRFHVLDADGRWQTGAYGFALIWAHLPRYRRLARWLVRLRLLPLLDGLYTLWARWRLRRRCAEGACSVR
jgi:predicted DCC family thiol-disulfide oxidoreductase YuxK